MTAFYGPFFSQERGDKKSHDHSGKLVIEFRSIQVYSEYSSNLQIKRGPQRNLFPPFEDTHLFLLICKTVFFLYSRHSNFVI
jgi:hypothetical protein